MSLCILGGNFVHQGISPQTAINKMIHSTPPPPPPQHTHTPNILLGLPLTDIFFREIMSFVAFRYKCMHICWSQSQP